MKKIILPLILVAISILVGCANGSVEKDSTRVSETRQVELAYPYIYEKGINYNGDLSAREVMQCLGNVKMHWSSKPSEFNSFYIIHRFGTRLYPKLIIKPGFLKSNKK